LVRLAAVAQIADGVFRGYRDGFYVPAHVPDVRSESQELIERIQNTSAKLLEIELVVKFPCPRSEIVVPILSIVCHSGDLNHGLRARTPRPGC